MSNTPIHVFTYSEARQKLKDVLDLARKEGEVRIQRRNGATFSLTAVSEHDENKSPLDVGCVETSIPRDEIVRAVREGHERV
ncbi:type II toxin-antitoxin system Phd/YefM family antitoxin [Salinibacter ruber]|uniref:type II toxin-antitoxin system Phd/YefM family antitoxin n=1 Tax=Salinibacter ruber TaxID=146919 RepID=UPI002169308E|nr:type II toxin-antitoxin system Phd/YefM family antitoxin [Salinibacter ruber]MCS3783640.1 prevent-host-death family protein [Salinibacter ruber]